MERGLSIFIVCGVIPDLRSRRGRAFVSGRNPMTTGWGGRMLQAEGAAGPVKVEFDNFEHGFPDGFGPGGWGHLAYAIGIAFAAFQLYVAAFNYLPSQVVRGVHVGFLILMTFGLISNFTARSNAGRAAGWLI